MGVHVIYDGVGIAEKCFYCGGSPDHACGNVHACGDCCAMHMETCEDANIYRWIEECLTRKNLELSQAQQRIEDLRKNLYKLVEQIEVYRGGWLGEDVWRDRVGLRGDILAAKKVIDEAK